MAECEAGWGSHHSGAACGLPPVVAVQWRAAREGMLSCLPAGGVMCTVHMHGICHIKGQLRGL